MGIYDRSGESILRHAQPLGDFLKIALIANTDWYLYNFRRGLALALVRAGHSVVLISPVGEHVPKLVALGLRWLELPLSRRGFNPWGELRSVFHLRRTLIAEQINVVHAFTIKGVICSGIASRLSGIAKRVYSIDGLGYIFSGRAIKAKILRPVVEIVLRLTLKGRSSRIIVQNTDDATLLVNGSICHPQQILIIRGAGVDCGRFARGGLREEGRPLRVLLAARLLFEKGILEYVQAARLLRESGRNIEFLLAGTPDVGNPASISEAEVQSWVREGCIRWLGHVEDMAALLGTVHIVTLPSAYREGLPTCLTEAAACGLPLVTTDNPGCREVVSDRVDGLLIPVRDGAALAHAIAELVDDHALAASLGHAAQAKARSHFDEKIIIERTLSVYEEVNSLA